MKGFPVLALIHAPSRLRGKAILVAACAACLHLACTTPSAHAVVTVTETNNVLYVTGDGQSNIVEIDGAGILGKVEVYVEGQKVDTFHNIESIEADLGDDSDGLEVSGIQIVGDLTVYGGEGNDSLRVDVETNAGGDFHSVFIGGNVLAPMGMSEYDSVDFSCAGKTNTSSNIHIAGDVTLFSAHDITFAGAGEHPDSGITREIVIDGMITIWSTPADDPRVPMGGYFNFRHVVVAGSTTILHTGNVGSESYLLRNHFGGRVAILMGGDVDDLLGIGVWPTNSPGIFEVTPDMANVFEDEVHVNLGQGFDTVIDNKSNVYAVPPVFIAEDVQ
jgi:hypothetical protein